MPTLLGWGCQWFNRTTPQTFPTLPTPTAIDCTSPSSSTRCGRLCGRLRPIACRELPAAGLRSVNPIPQAAWRTDWARKRNSTKTPFHESMECLWSAH